MADLLGAMIEESNYIQDKYNDVDTSLIDRLSVFGYETLEDYFQDKRCYMFNNWKPEVFYVDEDFLDTSMESAIINSIYGIYIIEPKSKYYAFHGNSDIDTDMCNELDIRIIEMHYNGGTIIGSEEDLGILIVSPSELMLDSSTIMSNILMMLQEYIKDAQIVGNDIVVGNNKILGSMIRSIGNSCVWAAQFSLSDHTELISKVCKKQSNKVPSFIDSSVLCRDELERRLLQWLQKQ